MKTASDGWHILAKNPNDIPEPGEHVIICVGDLYVGEGYMKLNGEWWRYCDFGPIETWMSRSVTAWMRFPSPPKIGNAGKKTNDKKHGGMKA